jgi:hypothetical protein
MTIPHNHVAIIGTGFGGIATAVRLRPRRADLRPARRAHRTTALEQLSPHHVMLLTGVGHTPPWEAPDRTAHLITTSLTNDGERCT